MECWRRDPNDLNYLPFFPRRMTSKSVVSDVPGAFDAREYLRELTVGKQVTFVTRMQQPDRAYGMVFLETTTATTTSANSG
jgi:hypothetical protein